MASNSPKSREKGKFCDIGEGKYIWIKTVKDEAGRTMVNFIWCKLCAKYEKAIINSPLAVYTSNKSQYLKNEERYGRTIDGVPSSFQEFFQIRFFQINFNTIM